MCDHRYVGILGASKVVWVHEGRLAHDGRLAREGRQALRRSPKRGGRVTLGFAAGLLAPRGPVAHQGQVTPR